ncbi:Biosynthetic arginine decarboxylase [Dissostichus eleginoides]|uniref:Biosynthetic arginine decarboxylase n=1 Tax=Dissostichus eleginoides TaxID=100907 RepID=A0AAD9FID4_DISEL|nr:Biosynthetic arginine decarboxylase [Dissostichus eleginoides]
MAGDKEKQESSAKLAEEEEMLGELKRERSGAQSAFTRKANILTRTANSSTEEKLKAEWDKFGREYCNLISANTDYIEALSEADTEASRQQANNVEKMAEDCDQRFAKVEQEVKSSLWSRFALLELAPLARRAERAMDQAERKVKRETFGLCERQNNYLRESIDKTNEKLASWKAWFPVAHASELEERVVSLTDLRESLWLQWEQEFSDSKSRAEDRHTANVAEWETATRSEDSVNAPPNPSGEPPASTERSAGSAQPGSASVPPGTAGRSVGAVGVPQ